MNIQNPTLRLMHRWNAMTLFSRQDIRFFHHAKLQVLYAMIKKTKIVPVKEIFKHWLHLFIASTSISCTSLVTRIATGVSVMDGQFIFQLHALLLMSITCCKDIT
jgi:hypothetical protein